MKQILLQYHVGPRLLRTECAKGTAVTQVANVTFNGKKCRVSEIKLISGKIQAETVLDIVSFIESDDFQVFRNRKKMTKINCD